MTKQQRAKALIPYLRQSKKHDGPQSLAGQRERIVAWAAANKVDLLPEVVERGVSGSKSWRERDLGAALERVRRGEAGGVVVSYLSRLTRENGLARAEFIEEWKSLPAARLVAIQESIDQASMEPKMFQFTLDIHGSIARLEWENRRQGFAEAREGAVRKGVHIASHAPAGYSFTETGKLNKNGNAAIGGLVPNEHAPAVRRLFEMRAKGRPWSECCAMLEEAAVPNRSGGKWMVGSAQAIVKNPTYTGQARHGDYVLEGAHDAIVEPSLWRRAQPKAGRKRGTAVAPFPSGMLRCGTCGRAMVPGGAEGRYRCRPSQIAGPDCEAPAHAMGASLEPALLARLYADQATKPAAPAVDLGPLQTAVATALARLEAWDAVDPLQMGDPSAWATKRAGLKAAVDEAEDVLSAATSAATEEGPVGSWDDMTPAERREWLTGWGVTVLVAAGKEPVVKRLTLVDRPFADFHADWRKAAGLG